MRIRFSRIQLNFVEISSSERLRNENVEKLCYSQANPGELFPKAVLPDNVMEHSISRRRELKHFLISYPNKRFEELLLFEKHTVS